VNRLIFIEEAFRVVTLSNFSTPHHIKHRFREGSRCVELWLGLEMGVATALAKLSSFE
jgi:hypothetical protein